MGNYYPCTLNKPSGEGSVKTSNERTVKAGWIHKIKEKWIILGARVMNV